MHVGICSARPRVRKLKYMTRIDTHRTVEGFLGDIFLESLRKQGVELSEATCAYVLVSF